MPLLFTTLIRSNPGLNYAMGIKVTLSRAVFFGNLYWTMSPILCFINHGLVGHKIPLPKKRNPGAPGLVRCWRSQGSTMGFGIACDMSQPAFSKIIFLGSLMASKQSFCAFMVPVLSVMRVCLHNVNISEWKVRTKVANTNVCII